jgi:hypothetical protein
MGVFAVGDGEEMIKGRGDRGQGARSDVPDLRTQWESLLDQVWRSEADWRLWDRLDAAVQIETMRQKREAAQQEKDLL